MASPAPEHTLIGHVLARAKALGMTQEEFGEQLGVSSGAVSNWITRNTFPEPHHKRAAEILKWTIQELLAVPQRVVSESVTDGAQFGVTTVTSVRRAPPTNGRVPLLDWDLTTVPPDTIPANAHWIETAEPLDATVGIALRVDQDGMCNPADPRSLSMGCYIVVRAVPPGWRPAGGDILLVRFNGQQRATLRQVTLDGDHRLFSQVNPTYPRPPDIEGALTILGRVVERIERTRF